MVLEVTGVRERMLGYVLVRLAAVHFVTLGQILEVRYLLLEMLLLLKGIRDHPGRVAAGPSQ